MQIDNNPPGIFIESDRDYILRVVNSGSKL